MDYRRIGTILLLTLVAALLLIFTHSPIRQIGQQASTVAPRTVPATARKAPPGQRLRQTLPESQPTRSPDPAIGRPLEQWIQTAVRKRDSSAPLEAGMLFQDGVGLLEIGDYREARKSFQKLINQHADSRLASYAFLGIAEACRLEGGDCLSQAAIQFQDFLVFFPNSELAPYARQRFIELEPILKANRSKHQAK